MIPQIQQLATWMLELSGLDDSLVKVLICALLSFPFSTIFKRLPDNNYTLKNVYNVAVSAFYITGVLDLYEGLRTLLISSLGSYFITRYLRTDSMPWVNFMFLMGHLAYNHLYLQFFNEYDATKIDISGALMILVMKLSSFGWSIHDAKQPIETLSPYARSRMIRKHPNLLPYLGYVFFYATLLTGPAFDYSDYDKFVHSTLFDDVPESKRPGRTRKRRIPRSGIPALFKTLEGFMWAGVLVVSSSYLSLDYVLNGGLWAEKNFFYRVFYLYVLGFSFRLKYYAIWLIAEGACIQCGIGYNGYDEKTDTFNWNRVQNVDPWAFETGQNVHVCLESWNMNTNKWLKNFVYMRLAKKGKKPGFKSVVSTFATSAFWHGTHPGYFLTFLTAAFLQTVGKIYRRNFRPIFLQEDGVTPKPLKKFYDIVCFVVTQLAFGFTVQPFMILKFQKSIYCWLVVYFYGHVGIALSLFAFEGPFGKTVKNWCKSKSDVKAAKPKQQMKNLSGDETLKVKEAVSNLIGKEEFDASAPTLGLPTLGQIEAIGKSDLNAEMKDLAQVWTSFKSRRTSIGDDDLEGLKDAYNNFTTEINEIIENVKKEARQKRD